MSLINKTVVMRFSFTCHVYSLTIHRNLVTLIEHSLFRVFLASYQSITAVYEI